MQAGNTFQDIHDGGLMCIDVPGGMVVELRERKEENGEREKNEDEPCCFLCRMTVDLCSILSNLVKDIYLCITSKEVCMSAD